MTEIVRFAMKNKSQSFQQPSSKRHKWQRLSVNKDLDWRKLAAGEGLYEVSAFIEHTIAWVLPHRYFQVEHRDDISMYSVTDATDVAKTILQREKRSDELNKLKTMEDPEVVAACVKLIQSSILAGTPKNKSRRELFHRHLDLVTAHRKEAESEFFNVKSRSKKEWTDQQNRLLNAIEANQKMLDRISPSDPKYLFLLNDKRDLFEKYEQTFHKGDILRDDLLNVVSYLDTEIRAFEEYHMLSPEKLSV